MTRQKSLTKVRCACTISSVPLQALLTLLSADDEDDLLDAILDAKAGGRQ